MSKVMGILSNFSIFSMPTDQIWSCHVTQDVNFELCYFFVILHLILFDMGFFEPSVMGGGHEGPPS